MTPTLARLPTYEVKNRKGFREVVFTPGVNLVLADRSTTAGEKDTTNALGKSTLIDIIDFLPRQQHPLLARTGPLAIVRSLVASGRKPAPIADISLLECRLAAALHALTLSERRDVVNYTGTSRGRSAALKVQLRFPYD
jgi:hypothetical protein